ncbi:multidrug effflux MFS transporter [Nonomuraea pusilla]|uniref:multidrug effflux MFS transporter n=1 Tax=Nonomuraea pusilla TaxID=46177 RepID=UPI0033230099
MPPRPSPGLTATLALLSVLVPLSTDMYLPGFPALAREFRADAAGAQLTLTAFLLGLAAGQLMLGPLSDRLGRRAPILAGSALCTAATALCAVAPSLATLTALRFVMGFTGAAGVVVGRAVIADVASGAAAARLFALLMALGGIAPIVAPLAGGAVVSATGGWRAAFWVLAAASALMFAAALVKVPETLPPRRRRTAGAGATLRAARSVVADRPYLGYTLASCLTVASLFCYISASPFLLQDVLGFSVGEASAVFSAGALTATVSTLAAGRLAGRVRPETLTLAGLVTMAAACGAALAVTLAGGLGRVTALGLVAVAFVGLGLVFATVTGLALERVPHAAGTGSAVLGTLQSVLAAAVAPLMGVGGGQAAVPLFAGMTGCSALALLALLLTRRARPGAPDPAVSPPAPTATAGGERSAP